jgi:hypothetical protein
MSAVNLKTFLIIGILIGVLQVMSQGLIGFSSSIEQTSHASGAGPTEADPKVEIDWEWICPRMAMNEMGAMVWIFSVGTIFSAFIFIRKIFNFQFFDLPPPAHF